MWQRQLFINCWQFYLTPRDSVISKGHFFESYFVFSCCIHSGIGVTPLFVFSWCLEVEAEADWEIKICTDKRRWEKKQAEESEIIKAIFRFGNSSQSPSCPRLGLAHQATISRLKRSKPEELVRSKAQPRRGVCFELRGNCSAPFAGLRLPSASHGQDVRLQEIREEEDQEEERRIHGAQWEADFRKSQ